MEGLRLTKGISGFDAAHLIEQDMRMFQSMVYHLVTSEQRAKVRQFIDQAPFVYMQAVIEIDGETLTILHHRLMPYIAFAKQEVNSFTFYPSLTCINIFLCENAWKRRHLQHY